MDFKKLYNHRFYYNLDMKLMEHVTRRSQECFDRNRETRAGIKTKEELFAYAKKTREKFIENLSGIPYDNTLPLNAEVTGVIDEEGLTIEKIIFQSRPSVYVVGNLYIPEKRKNPCGAVLFQCGHSKESKAYSYYQSAARIIASAGLIVFVVDPIGQGERSSYFDNETKKPSIPLGSADHQYTGERCVLAGDSLARYFIADAMRAIDYLLTRPEVDKNKIGATGNSGAGTQTGHLMVCDDRIKAAAPGTFITTREAYYYAYGVQDSEQIWYSATKDGFDHHEILICFAPKPALILATDADFFCIEGADEVMEICKPFWEMHGKGDDLRFAHDNVIHEYTPNLAKVAASFFAKYLNDEDRGYDGKPITPLPQSEINCTPEGQISLTYPDAKFPFDENRERIAELKADKSAAEFIKERMFDYRTKVPLRLKEYPAYEMDDYTITPLLWLSHKFMPNCAFLFNKKDKAYNKITVCIWEDGTNDLESHMQKIEEICASGNAALVVDLTANGRCMPLSSHIALTYDKYSVVDKLNKDLFFLGDSICAIRLFELNYILTELCPNLGAEGELYAEGRFSLLTSLYQLAFPETKIETAKERETYMDIVNNKYYDIRGISEHLFPGIIKYIK